jgi:hypothetical protein
MKGKKAGEPSIHFIVGVFPVKNHNSFFPIIWNLESITYQGQEVL